MTRDAGLAVPYLFFIYSFLNLKSIEEIEDRRDRILSEKMLQMIKKSRV